MMKTIVSEQVARYISLLEWHRFRQKSDRLGVGGNV